MRHRTINLDVLVVLGVAAMAILYATSGGGWLEAVVRIVVGVPLVLFLPGYAIIRALPPRWSRAGENGMEERSDGLVARIERSAWTTGLSIGVAIFGAFLLDLSPGGLNRVSWLIFLGSVTVVAGTVASVRQRVASGADARVPAGPANAGRGPLRMGGQPVAMFVGAALIAVLALGISVRSEAEVPHPGFAQFWLVPQPVTREGSATTADLGVHSFEEGDRRYRLVLLREGTVVGEWSFVLRPGDVWRERVDLPPGQSAEAVLYRGSDPAPYRRVTLQSP